MIAALQSGIVPLHDPVALREIFKTMDQGEARKLKRKFRKIWRAEQLREEKIAKKLKKRSPKIFKPAKRRDVVCTLVRKKAANLRNCLNMSYDR